MGRPRKKPRTRISSTTESPMCCFTLIERPATPVVFARISSRARLRMPEIGILDHESILVHFEVARERAARAFVPVTVRRESSVTLLQQLQRQLRESHPSRTHCRFRTDLQCETANRKQIRRRAETEIDVLRS